MTITVWTALHRPDCKCYEGNQAIDDYIDSACIASHLLDSDLYTGREVVTSDGIFQTWNRRHPRK